jgi:hypothetical protein
MSFCSMFCVSKVPAKRALAGPLKQIYIDPKDFMQRGSYSLRKYHVKGETDLQDVAFESRKR